MKKEQVLKILSLIVIIVVLIFLTMQLMPMFKGLSSKQGRIEFKEKIENLGISGALAIIGLMFAQVFLAILPGEPVEILAGMCYGPIGGMIILFIGAFFSSAFIFFLVRKFGKNFIYSFVSKEKIDKLENSKMFSNHKKIYSIIFILFFIPGLPKDIIVYISGLLPIKPIKFLIISTIARFPSIISSTIVGANIMDGNLKIIAIVYVITFVISGIIIYMVNKREKTIDI